MRRASRDSRAASAPVDAEAAAAKARQRDEQAEVAEQEAEVAEASGDEQRSKRAARRSRGARKRANDAHKLAIEKAEAAGLDLISTAVSDAWAMPQRTIPTDAVGNPRPQAQRNFTDPDSHILKGSDGWIQGYNCQAAVDGDHITLVRIAVAVLLRYIAQCGPRADIVPAGIQRYHHRIGGLADRLGWSGDGCQHC